MSVTSSRKLRDIAEAQVGGGDVKQATLAAVGDYSGIEVGPYRVLVAIAIRPAKQGLLWMPDRQQAEDRFQGKSGLVLKIGPGAFTDTASHKFHGFTAKEGDWVGFTASDGRELFKTDPDSPSDGTPCRLFWDQDISMRLEHPFLIY